MDCWLLLMAKDGGQPACDDAETLPPLEALGSDSMEAVEADDTELLLLLVDTKCPLDS
jgi:hypothetical protein